MLPFVMSLSIPDADLDHAVACLQAYKADRSVAQSFGLLTEAGIATFIFNAVEEKQ